MADLTITINTDDFDCDYDVESIISQEIIMEAKKKMVASGIQEQVQKAGVQLAESCGNEIEKKLINLINEDVSITDKWGKVIFVGNVEDYMKKEIDEKLLKSVNDYDGKPSKNCSIGEGMTWVEYTIKKMLASYLNNFDNKINTILKNEFQPIMDKKLKEMKTIGLNDLIMKRLEKAGL